MLAMRAVAGIVEQSIAKCHCKIVKEASREQVGVGAEFAER